MHARQSVTGPNEVTDSECRVAGSDLRTHQFDEAGTASETQALASADTDNTYRASGEKATPVVNIMWALGIVQRVDRGWVDMTYNHAHRFSTPWLPPHGPSVHSHVSHAHAHRDGSLRGPDGYLAAVTAQGKGGAWLLAGPGS